MTISASPRHVQELRTRTGAGPRRNASAGADIDAVGQAIVQGGRFKSDSARRPGFTSRQSNLLSRNYLIDLEKGKGSPYITRLFRTLDELGITVTLTDQSSDDEASDRDS